MAIAEVQLPDGRIAKLEVPDGTSEQDIIAFVQQNYGGEDGTTPQEPLAPEWAQENPNLYGAVGAGAEMLKPILSMGGLIGGGIVGTPGGPPGMVAGAGLGYGMGENINRQMDVALGNELPYSGMIEAAKQTAADVGTGAAYEMGGQAVGPMLGAVARRAAPLVERLPIVGRPTAGRGLPGTPGRAKVDAGEALLEAQPKTIDDLIASGKTEMETAMAAERAGVGGRLTEAELTGNKQLALMEQAQAKAGGGVDFAGKMLQENEAAVLAGRNQVENVIAGGQVVPISKDELGAVVRESLKLRHKESYEAVTEAYKAIPESVTVGVGNTGKEINAIIKQMTADGDVGLMTPAGQKVLGILKEVLVGKAPTQAPQVAGKYRAQIGSATAPKPKTVSLTRLSNLRRQISDVASAAYSSGEKTTWRSLTQFRSKIDDIIEAGEGIAPQYAEQSKIARETFAKHRDMYEYGKIADVLGTGKEFGGMKIVEEAIPSKFFSSGSISPAKQLIEVVGKEEAKKLAVESGKAEAIRVMQSATEPKALMNWLKQNERVFEVYGIKPSEILDKGLVKDLLVGKYKDPTLNQLSTRLKQIGNKQLGEIFNPKEVRALRDYHTLLKAVQRNQNVTAGGGSTTADAMSMSQSSKMSGIAKGVMQIAALKAGMGYAYNAATGILKGMYQLGIKNPQTVGQILEEAAYNPTLAKQMMDLAKKAGTKNLSKVEVNSYRRALQQYTQSGYISPIGKTQKPMSMYGAPPAMGYGYDELIQRELGAN